MTVKAAPLEELVAEMVFACVDDAALRATIETKGEADDGVLSAIQRDETALEALAQDFYVDQILSREEFLAARKALTERLEANRLRLARRTSAGAVGRFLGQAELLRQAWSNGSLDWRRSILGSLVERIEIAAGRSGRLPFDPQRVRPVWKY